MLELWKPLVVKSKKGIPVICNVFEDKLNRPYRPFVIFYDDQEDCYYYLRARSAIKYDNTGNPFKIKPNKYEILVDVEEDSEQELFREKSYVDCSQIFKCNRETLELLIDKNSDAYKETFQLDSIYINQIKQSLLTSIMETPPYLSIIAVDVDFENKIPSFESLYLSESLFNDESNKLNNPEKYNFNYFNSSKANSLKRYQTGIDFCLMIINEFYPEKMNEFMDTQEIEFDSENSFDDEEYEYDPFVEISAKIYLNWKEYSFSSFNEFKKFISDLDSEQLESIRFDDWSDEDLYNDCSELLKKLKEDIKAKDRGGDGGMSI